MDWLFKMNVPSKDIEKIYGWVQKKPSQKSFCETLSNSMFAGYKKDTEKTNVFSVSLISLSRKTAFPKYSPAQHCLEPIEKLLPEKADLIFWSTFFVKHVYEIRGLKTSATSYRFRNNIYSCPLF
jgi:hypothetical protein